MICLTLPNFIQNLNFNNKLNKYIQKFPNNKKFNFFIGYYSGNYNYNYWNGENNLNFDKTLLYKDFEEIRNISSKVLRLNCSNINLNNNDFFNSYNENILKINDEVNNCIELCNLDLYNYIKNNYISFNYIFSQNADLINEFTPEIINAINEQNIFTLIEIPFYYNNNKEFLNNIINKQTIEIIIGEKCNNCSKEQIKKCKIQENLNQFNFSNKTVYNCNYINQYNNFSILEQEIKKFIKMGFSHFKIDTPPYQKNKEFKKFLIKNLIKEEYWQHAFEFIGE